MKLTDKILNVLDGNELTSDEISQRTGIPLKNLWSYLHRLKHLGKIETTDSRQPFIYRSITPEVLLKKLHKLMMDKMEPSVGSELSNNDFHILDIIEQKYAKVII